MSPNGPLNSQNWSRLDQRYLWHPFTPNNSWLDPNYEPLCIVSSRGRTLIAEDGRTFLDGNSSIWTNIHGHNHPEILRAIIDQLHQLDHLSFLGQTHPAAIELAVALSERVSGGQHRVFYSSDGSSAVEAALKIAYQAWQQSTQPQRRRFITFQGSYHGDTVGAMSLGGSEAMHEPFRPLLFDSRKVMAPACYRCPHNIAPFSPYDARLSRQCEWQCIEQLEEAVAQENDQLAAVIMEPRVQGAAGMWMHPHGYLSRARPIIEASGAYWILDEILTGFGRTGTLFAFEQEITPPSILVLGKGLSGGTMPIAATLVREEIFQKFNGPFHHTFFHGHSYSGHPPSCAAALANLRLFEKEKTLSRLQPLIDQMREESQRFWRHPNVGDVRQEGFILAIELVQNRHTKESFPTEARLAYHICERARQYGLLTRGIHATLILIPPLTTLPDELSRMIDALWRALVEVLPFDVQAA
ncbi:MAG: adenosylmethionine--8-amino-7-oxononanoate transaminase [Methylacidiphilales bacterium]|nr:adenosylmethionine--8-amino-7-oxononanoate transaminase [Candidatus Methylacidiphilales bacterium]MDW8349829.1 adenosylmethionine--8-amino-7-oxononanoate transaminase [Verrucomicrobiae bacterium]